MRVELIVLLVRVCVLHEPDTAPIECYEVKHRYESREACREELGAIGGSLLTSVEAMHPGDLVQFDDFDCYAKFFRKIPLITEPPLRL